MRLLLEENHPGSNGFTVAEINPKMFIPGEIHPSGQDIYVREDYFDLLNPEEYAIMMDYIDTWIDEAEEERDEAQEEGPTMQARGRGRARRQARREFRQNKRRERQQARIYRKNLRIEERTGRKAERVAAKAAVTYAKAEYGAKTGEFDPTTGELIVSGIREVAPHAAGIIGAIKGGIGGMPIFDQLGNIVGRTPPPPPPPPPRILGMHPALAIGLGVVVLGGVTFLLTRKR